MKVYTEENPLVVFKMLNADGSAPWGKGKWPLPKDGKRGATMGVIGDLEVCVNGLHGFKGTLSMVRSRLFAEYLFVAELWGEVIEGDNKVCARFGRLCYKVEGWNETTARLFAVDCAEHTLANFEKKYPNDNRPSLAIFAARQRAFDFDYDRAASYAANSAANSAAYSAETNWQAHRLHAYLTGAVDLEAIKESVRPKEGA
jgi:hypothetical protein